MEEIFSNEDKVIITTLIGVLMLLLMGVALLVFFFLSRRKITEKELEKKTLEIGYQKEIIQSIIVTQEKERKRIAQDLHDDISSKLNVINLNANLLKDGELTAEEFITVNDGILTATDKTLESARRIAHNLLPPILDKFGFKEAVEELVDTFNNSRKIDINYNLKYPKKHLNSSQELHLFRIIQELINNSIRHGNATKSTLVIEEKNKSLFLNYSDNGIGFNLKELEFKKGLGMKNIESRVSILNGIFTIETDINSGFAIKITI
ncbi:sensor histidine kinase [Polaribacter haliotis]|uniref:histidine kinase n=1 Tax=Polaribacter haliotis TaxID=1888915 RepID=A0A7L8ADQ6_9FLAO|nr:histidine kinase [Polaribacter haliotis]QOD60121.1 sensor histidine kinase [Polaribacter haliotis]